MTPDHDIDSTGVKACTLCGELKPLDQYQRDKSRKTGRRERCKACCSAIDAARHAANPERKRRNATAWARANPRRVRERNRTWYRADRERHKAQQDAWRQQHQERLRASRERWLAAHPERYRAGVAIYAAIRAGRLPAANTMVCEVCGEALAAHWHHHKGYSPEHIMDVIAVCRDCHGAAHRKDEHGRRPIA